MIQTAHRSSRQRLPRLIGLVVMLQATIGCATVQSDYSRQHLPVEHTWQQQERTTPEQTIGPWWDEFGDAALSALVERTLEQNADLAAAGLRLNQARMSAALAATQLFPSVGAGLSSGASAGFGTGGAWSESASGSLDASWESDLFGRLGASRRAAEWEAQATAQDLAATRLAIAGSVVSNWWQLAYVNERITLANDSLRYQRKTLELIGRQYDAGAVSLLEIREAEQAVASQEAALTQFEQARIETRNALAALLGQQVYDGAEPTALPRKGLPQVDAGIPAELLSRRPDLTASEDRLRKLLANADATEASYYPRLSLTGALGSASSNLLSFISNPVASLGAVLSVTTLNPEEIRLSTAVARADYEIAAAQFRQDFYDALRDVANALAAREHFIEQATALDEVLATASDAANLYGRQYAAGSVELRSLLDADERKRSAEAGVIENRLNQLNAQIALHQALGGDIPGSLANAAE